MSFRDGDGDRPPRTACEDAGYSSVAQRRVAIQPIGLGGIRDVNPGRNASRKSNALLPRSFLDLDANSVLEPIRVGKLPQVLGLERAGLGWVDPVGFSDAASRNS